MKAALLLVLCGLAEVSLGLSSSNYLSSLSQRSNPSAIQPSAPTTTSAYLNSLCPDAAGNSVQHEIHDDVAHQQIPDEWYGKAKPMASWAGFQHPQWGGYLDNLGQRKEGHASSNAISNNDDDDQDLVNPVFREGKRSDYGNDVRWGAGVYLNAIEDDSSNDNHA